MQRAHVLVGILVLPVLLAACTLPGPEDPFEDSLDPVFAGIPGLTPDHARSHPVAIHVTPDGKRAYVALAGTIARPDDRVAVVDLEEGRLVQHITVGRRPLAFAADPQAPDRLLVAHPYSPSISVIDTEQRLLSATLPAPYYIEDLAFTPDGERLVGIDRDQDRLIVFNVTRDDDNSALAIQQARSLSTGPNPEHVVVVPPPADADWGGAVLVAATDRHGASVTLADLDAGTTRRVATGGAPLALAARDGLVFVAGYGPGNGTGTAVEGSNRTVDSGTAAIENSLLVLDVRNGPALFGDDPPRIAAQRYLSDTAHPDKTHPRLKVLGGAGPRALTFSDEAGNASVADNPLNGTLLWIAYHGTDQVQALRYMPPGDQNLSADVVSTRSGAIGERLSHLAPDRPLTPGRLTDTVHGIFETHPGPTDLVRLDDLLLVVAEFPEQLHVIDLADCPGATAATSPCTSTTIPLVADPLPYPSGPYEEGERLFYSAIPSADQDRSCASCHIGGLSTGTTWALPHRNGTPVRIPRLDQVADNTPWLYDGTAQVPADYLEAAGGDLLIPDPTDPHNLATRSSEEGTPTDDPRFPGLRGRLLGLGTNATTAGDYMRATFAYAMGEERLLPVPPRLGDAATEQGQTLFGTTRTECMSCHGDGGEATLLTGARAEGIPKPAGADQIKAPPLGGLWDRQGIGYLHDGRASTLHQALLPRGSSCLMDPAAGLASSWHGDLAARTCGSVDELVGYLLAFEARR